MVTFDKDNNVQLRNNNVHRVPCHRKHVQIVKYVVLITGIFAVLCMAVPGGLSPLSVSPKPPVLHAQKSRRDPFKRSAIAMVAHYKQPSRALRYPPVHVRTNSFLRFMQAAKTRQFVELAKGWQSQQMAMGRQVQVAAAMQSFDASTNPGDTAAAKSTGSFRVPGRAGVSPVRAVPAPGTPGASPAQTVRALYDAFNAKNATATAELLAEDCVYEDLLLGEATVCRGRNAFEAALRFHPAFVGATLTSVLPDEWARRIPGIVLVIDSVAEDPVRGTVGVEWHVAIQRLEPDESGLLRVTTNPFPLGRGLSHAKVDLATGKIKNVVDIAEAPWRVVGLALSPFIATLAALHTEAFRRAALVTARRHFREENSNKGSQFSMQAQQLVLKRDVSAGRVATDGSLSSTSSGSGRG
jgi:hypothetical protein